MSDTIEIGRATLHRADCLEVMTDMADNSIDAIITDPPYFRVKGEDWDNQWDSDAAFLAWVDRLLMEFARLLVPNGSLFFFASPQMAARVEVAMRRHFNVLNHITWRKGKAGMKTQGWANKSAKEALRCFVPETERIIFAEHYNSDNIARGEAGYLAKCDELRGFVFEPLRAYLAGEWERAGLTKRDAEQATGTQMAGHWFTRSQWALPTEHHYATLRAVANQNGGEYLRRPFALSSRDQWSDVWEFDPVGAYPGKHPCEKPLPLLMHMLGASTRPDALVLDPFMGSGSMGHACHELGRRFVGIEKCPQNFTKALQRIEAAQAQQKLSF